MNVLVVEDDPSSSMFLSGAIRSQGHEIRTAIDGIQGLKAFEEWSPDLVFSDIQMPGMDGLDMLAKIREKNPDAIVVMTTAFGQEEYTLRALRLKANDYLRKPFPVDAVLALLQKYGQIVETRTIHQEFFERIVRRECTVKIGNRLEAVSKIVDRLMLETGDRIPRRERLGIHLGLLEILTNAIEHGNLEITYDEKSRAMEQPDGWYALLDQRLGDSRFSGREVTIDFRLNAECCEWTITDEGPGFNWNTLPDPTAEAALFEAHGRGIMLSKIQFDEFEYRGRGNEIRLKKCLKPRNGNKT